jgi:hypothetical protein
MEFEGNLNECFNYRKCHIFLFASSNIYFVNFYFEPPPPSPRRVAHPSTVLCWSHMVAPTRDPRCIKLIKSVSPYNLAVGQPGHPHRCHVVVPTRNPKCIRLIELVSPYNLAVGRPGHMHMSCVVVPQCNRGT